MIVGDIKMARRRLPQRADTEDHPILLPSLFIDFQDGNAGGGPRQSGLEAANRLFAAKAMWNRNDKRR